MFGYYSAFDRADTIFYLVVILPIFMLSIFVSIKMKFIYSKYSKFKSLGGLTGAVVARSILDSYGLYGVRVEAISGVLTDHYDPRSNVVRLSYANYNGTSIASIGVVAHEVGHAVQYAKNYFPIKIRAAIVPATRFGSFLAMPIFIAGILLSNLRFAYFGIILFGLVAFFSFITLPVEFNASSRAVKILESQGILNEIEISGVKKVLWAAAMTYVASFLSSLAQLVRLILIVNSRDDD